MTKSNGSWVVKSVAVNFSHGITQQISSSDKTLVDNSLEIVKSEIKLRST